MKACLFKTAGAIALSFTLAACSAGVVPEVAVPAPAPTPTPVATTAPPQQPTIPQPRHDNFMDAPQTPGTWFYVDEPAETLGLFGASPTDPMFIIRCDKTTRKVGIARRSMVAESQVMKVETETATRDLSARQMGAGGLVAVDLDARDPLLDSMAVTKGRFAISTPGAPSLYIPAWVEVSRVIEDCR